MSSDGGRGNEESPWVVEVEMAGADVIYANREVA